MKTPEEKAKAYDNALGWMREVYPTLTGATKEDAEHYFPELKESEDERIRKEAISIVQSYMNICDKEGDPCLSGYKVLAWLEKQKELLTPEEKMKHPLYVEGFEAGKQVGTQYEAVFGKRKEQKPAWSEEDERKLNDVICIVGKSGLITPYREHYIRFLKSLCPPFKPTQEQMEALVTAISTMRFQLNVGDKRLNSLYEDLKKL